MGQAIATAAFMCKKYKIVPSEIVADHIDELQQILLRDGLSIPHVFNHDPLDLARRAKVSADSFVEDGNPENVVNGRTRATDGEAYAWISKEGLPQSLMLELEREEEIGEIIITFDIPFDKYEHGFKPTPIHGELVTDFTVEIMHGNTWVPVAKIKDNIQRLVDLKFDKIKASHVRLTVEAAVATNHAVIAEIRIYNE
jgi:hypothetical protein